jgi:hypothetical protein
MASNKNVNGVSPKGVAVFPWLTKPDTKFRAEGQYKVTLRVSEDEAEALKKQIDSLSEEALKETKKDLTKKLNEAATGRDKAKYKQAIESLEVNTPYSEAVDDEGNTTGELEFRFSTSAVVKRKDGSTEPKALIFVDAKKQRFNPPSVYGGSVLRIAYSASPYYVAARNSVGVSLYIQAVQVIKLVSGSDSGDGFGFGEEDGFVSEKNETTFKEETIEESDAEF